MENVEIQDDSIRLGQLLKLADLAEHGAEAKAMLEAGEVRVNAATETRRGKQLIPGDEVEVGGETIRVVTTA